MALDDILAAIRLEAETETRAIDAAADRRVEDILTEARRRAAAEEELLIASRRGKAEASAAAIVNRARLDVARALRGERAALFEEALGKVGDRLSRLRATPEYPDHLARFLAEAAAALPDARIVRVDPRDADVVERVAEELVGDIGEGWRVEPTLQTWGGVDVVTEDGRVVHNTLEARLDKALPELRRLGVASLQEAR